MTFEYGPGTQVCTNATWVLLIDRLGEDTYALRGPGEVSLANTEALKKYINQWIGECNGLGGDNVGAA